MRRFMRIGARIGAVAGIVLAMELEYRGAHAGANVGFTAPSYVDTGYAGGEPLVMNTGKTLVYSTHSGATHLYRSGITTSSFATWLAQNRDQVFVWTSSDNGKSWQRVSLASTGVTSPEASGFSDPDLTMDEGGTIYNTGINLANDSVFASTDGGRTWLEGNPDCHDGDRPWLAGGKKGVVYMATDVAEGSLSHQIFQGTVGPGGVITCSTSGVSDTDGSSYSGYGKLYYDHHNGNLIEPAVFNNTNGATDGIGVSIEKSYGTPFVPHKAAANTSIFAHWPAMAIDKGDNIYVTWDTNPRDPNNLTGCNGTAAPLPNAIMLAASHDRGATWHVYTVAQPRNTRVLWPWIVAGDSGKVSVVWYQLSKTADPDCQDAGTYIYEAHILNAAGAAPQITITNASGRSIHDGQICQGGTGCVATGQDRRLGDFFTNDLDNNGCVIIASGDTMLTDPVTGGQLETSRPIFIRQNKGPALIGNHQCH